jgi:hypothetical protein
MICNVSTHVIPNAKQWTRIASAPRPLYVMAAHGGGLVKSTHAFGSRQRLKNNNVIRSMLKKMKISFFLACSSI